MALLLTPEQELIQKVVREFAQNELAPDATAVDRGMRFPRDHLKRMAPLGLLGMFLPSDQGGSGTDTLSFVVAVEEVARVSGTDAALLVLANAMVTEPLHRLATPEQRERFLVPTLAGERLGAAALTEESGGSSLEDILTRARPVEGGFELTGSKAFVSCAGAADYYVVLAREDGQGLSLFLVDASVQGLHFSEAESKLGLRGLPLAEMYLNRVRVRADARLGQAGQGTAAFAPSLELARLGVSAGLLGFTQAALDLSIAFAQTRVQFAQPIARFGGIRGFIAEVEAELEAARATTYGAAALRDAGRAFEEEVLEARYLSHRIAVKGTRIAHKIHGGAGFMRDLPLERVSRDVRTLMHLWDAQDITKARLADNFLGTRGGRS